MIDNHLDVYGYYMAGYREKLAPYMELFIALDRELVKLGENQVGHKQLASARNNLESSLLCCAKVVALQYESSEGKGQQPAKE